MKLHGNPLVRWGTAAIVATLLILPSTAFAATYVVKPTGNDAFSGLYTGTPSEPMPGAQCRKRWRQRRRAISSTSDTAFTTKTRRKPGSKKNAGFRPANSGTAGNPIVFKNYPGDNRPIIKGVIGERYAGVFTDRHYIILDSLEFRSGYRGLFTNASEGLVIRFCKIDSTRGPTGGNNNGGIISYLGGGSTIAVRGLVATETRYSTTAMTGITTSRVMLQGCTYTVVRIVQYEATQFTGKRTLFT